MNDITIIIESILLTFFIIGLVGVVVLMILVLYKAYQVISSKIRSRRSKKRPEIQVYIDPLPVRYNRKHH